MCHTCLKQMSIIGSVLASALPYRVSLLAGWGWEERGGAGGGGVAGLVLAGGHYMLHPEEIMDDLIRYEPFSRKK